MTNFDNLTPEEQFIYKWQYHTLGDFKTALIKAISLADEDNLLLIEMGFPVEVRGYKLYTEQSGWWQEVERKMIEEK